MAVVGGLLIFIGLAGMVVAVWALAKGSLTWANIGTRKAAAGVLAGAFVVTMVGGGLSPQDDDAKVAMQTGASDSTSTTTAPSTSTSEATTSTTPESRVTTAAPATSSSAPATSTTARVTTSSRPATTTTRPTATTAKPTTTTTAKPVTTTTKPPATGGSLTFGTLQCDAPGADNTTANLNEEWVQLVNGGAAVALTGWTIHDDGTKHTFAFPTGFTLAAGGRLTLHSGIGVNTATDLYWGRSQHVWNNDGDTAHLVNSAGTAVTSKTC